MKTTSGSPRSPGRDNSVAINAFSRVMSIIFLTLLLGVAGSYLDKWLEMKIWTLVGFVAGGAIAMVGMLYVVKAAEFDRKSQEQAAKKSSQESAEAGESESDGKDGPQ